MEKHFPERRLFLRSDTDTRFIRLKPATQLIAFSGSAAVVAWTIIATAVLLIDSIGSGNFREQAKRDQRVYQQRLNAVAGERDMRAEEALAAQERFNSALEQISVMQSQLLEAETRLREAETGLGVVQTTLRRTLKERDTARDEAEALTAQLGQGDTPVPGSTAAAVNKEALQFMTAALAQTAQERDQVTADAGTGRIEGVAETFWFGFKDDMVVRIADGAIDFRSVSRVGVSDLGANAARIAALRDAIAERLNR